jgi:hypothetical protein
VTLRAKLGTAFAGVPGVGGRMANKQRNEDQEQIADDNVVGKAVGEEEEEDLDDADEFDEADEEDDTEDVGEE